MVAPQRSSVPPCPLSSFPRCAPLRGFGTAGSRRGSQTTTGLGRHGHQKLRCRHALEITKAEKIDRSFVNRLVRLTLLAPDIQEAILEGRQAKGMQLEELTRAMPAEWGEQLQYVAQAAP